jgi:hypothetical protein
LIATLSDSKATTGFNDLVYSEADQIAQPTSVQWDIIHKSSGNFVSGGTLHFDLTKAGFLSRAVLKLDYQWPTANNTNYCANPYLNTISEIDLSTNGRTICTITRESMMAHFATVPTEVRGVYEEAIMLHDGNAAAAAPSTHAQPFLLDLDFFFRKAGGKYSLFTNFLQPIRVTVKFRDWSHITHGDNITARTTTSVALGESSDPVPTLYCLYRNQSEDATTAVVNANYESGLLSQLLQTYSMESGVTEWTHGNNTGNPDPATPANAGTGRQFTVNLRDTSCIERMWVMVYVEPENAIPSDGNTPGGNHTPLGKASGGLPIPLIGDIEFMSNGTTFFKVPARMLELYGCPSTHGVGAFYSGRTGTVAGGFNHVYCIELGTGCDSDKVQNLLSLRELAAPTIRVTTQAPTITNGAWNESWAGMQATCMVVHQRRIIATTTSNTGRFQCSLSN